MIEGVGAYTADRASALSGVPQSTIHWWARNSILIPSVSSERVKLWSYADLMSLRVIYWLRRRKTTKEGAEIPRSSMGAVRRALAKLHDLDVPLWRGDQPGVWVNGDGEIYHAGPGGPENLHGQLGRDDLLDLVAPFDTTEGLHGPHLTRPRPGLRIVPGRLSGSPHIVHTRVETRALFALEQGGFSTDRVRSLYPYLSGEHVEQALDLERQLHENVAHAA